MPTRKTPCDLCCWECGRRFTANRQTAFLCSAKCRQKWCRARKRGSPVKHKDAVLFDYQRSSAVWCYKHKIQVW